MTLAEALAEADREGYNAVNFQEFTFVPTRESPDHDHPEFEETMRWYYPLLPRAMTTAEGMETPAEPVDLAVTGRPPRRVPGQQMYPIVPDAPLPLPQPRPRHPEKSCSGATTIARSRWAGTAGVRGWMSATSP